MSEIRIQKTGEPDVIENDVDDVGRTGGPVLGLRPPRRRLGGRAADDSLELRLKRGCHRRTPIRELQTL